MKRKLELFSDREKKRRKLNKDQDFVSPKSRALKEEKLDDNMITTQLEAMMEKRRKRKSKFRTPKKKKKKRKKIPSKIIKTPVKSKNVFPIDWSIKERMEIASNVDFGWSFRQTRDTPPHDPKVVSICRRAFSNAISYFVHPDSDFDCGKFNTLDFRSIKNPLRREKREKHVQRRWEDSFRSLYEEFVNGNVPYFYILGVNNYKENKRSILVSNVRKEPHVYCMVFVRSSICQNDIAKVVISCGTKKNKFEHILLENEIKFTNDENNDEEEEDEEKDDCDSNSSTKGNVNTIVIFGYYEIHKFVNVMLMILGRNFESKKIEKKPNESEVKGILKQQKKKKDKKKIKNKDANDDDEREGNEDLGIPGIPLLISPNIPFLYSTFIRNNVTKYSHKSKTFCEIEGLLLPHFVQNMYKILALLSDTFSFSVYPMQITSSLNMYKKDAMKEVKESGFGVFKMKEEEDFDYLRKKEMVDNEHRIVSKVIYQRNKNIQVVMDKRRYF